MAEEPKKEENVVEINEVTEPEPNAFATDGLLPEEVEMAKEHGLVKEEAKKEESKDDEHAEQSEPEAKEDIDGEKDDTGEKSKETEESVEKPTFEDVSKDENKLNKYTPNEQALYWKWKADKRKRQEAQKEREEIKAELELMKVKGISSTKKLQKVKEALASDNLTVEKLQEILDLDDNDEDSRPVTQADLKRLKSEEDSEKKELEKATAERKARLDTAEEIGYSKYGKEEFDRITKLANDVVLRDKTGLYKSVLEAAFSDREIEEEELIERVVTLAQIHEDYGKKKSESSKKELTENKDVTRAIENSKKKVSSATVGSRGGKRTVNYDDLTVDEAARLSVEEWMKLPDHIRDKLLMKS